MRRPEFLARHGRRPEGWFGRVLAKLMDWETSKENDAALDLLETVRVVVFWRLDLATDAPSTPLPG